MRFSRLASLLTTAPLALGTRVLAADAPAGTSAAEEAGGLPQLDASTWASQIFWLLLTFAALYYFFSQVFLPRLGGVIEERRNRIADDYDQAADFKRQAEDSQKAYERALADAKARAASIAAETKAAIDAEITEMEAESDERLERQVAAAESRIAETAEAARGAVTEAAQAVTADIVEALTGQKPDAAAVSAAIAEEARPHVQ